MKVLRWILVPIAIAGSVLFVCRFDLALGAGGWLLFLGQNVIMLLLAITIPASIVLHIMGLLKAGGRLSLAIYLLCSVVLFGVVSARMVHRVSESGGLLEAYSLWIGGNWVPF